VITVSSRPLAQLLWPTTAPPSLADVLGDPNDWRTRGACRSANYQLFDPAADGERIQGIPARALEAARYCHGCPVLQQCRQHAEDRQEQGVWAAEWRYAGGRKTRPIPLGAAVRAS
jgi:hypothetical protein